MSTNQFPWKSNYNIDNSTVDTQHRELFRQLNAIGATIASGSEDQHSLDRAIDELVTYAKLHFEDEQKLMRRKGIDERHYKQQEMEHHSFLYDLSKMRSLMIMDNINDGFDQLLQFVMSWLIFHTLQTDQLLGVQLKEIDQGKSAEEAYEAASAYSFGPAINRPVVDALVHLWTSAMDTVHELEAQLRASESNPASGKQ